MDNTISSLKCRDLDVRSMMALQIASAAVARADRRDPSEIAAVSIEVADALCDKLGRVEGAVVEARPHLPAPEAEVREWALSIWTHLEDRGLVRHVDPESLSKGDLEQWYAGEFEALVDHIKEGL